MELYQLLFFNGCVCDIARVMKYGFKSWILSLYLLSCECSGIIK